jgi:hypothetical protein
VRKDSQAQSAGSLDAGRPVFLVDFWGWDESGKIFFVISVRGGACVNSNCDMCRIRAIDNERCLFFQRVGMPQIGWLLANCSAMVM